MMEDMAEPAAPLRRTVARTRVAAVRDGTVIERPERLATEEPMEIRAGGPGQEPVSVAVTMRTPGHDFDLAVGFLASEGLVGSRDDVVSVRYCELPPDQPQHYNVVSVALSRPLDAGRLGRNFYATSSCGICGKASLEQVEVRCGVLPPGPPSPPRCSWLCPRPYAGRSASSSRPVGSTPPAASTGTATRSP